MKLCIHCKHRLASEAIPEDPQFSRCGFQRPVSPVTGLHLPLTSLTYCSTERLNTGRCKLSADNWEAADHVMTPEEEEELLREAKYV